MPYTINVIELASLLSDLDNKPVEAKPTTVSQPSKVIKFWAASRSGRKENGLPAGHRITVDLTNPKFHVATCSCPGWVNRGYCWASVEAVRQAKFDAPSGELGVYRGAL